MCSKQTFFRLLPNGLDSGLRYESFLYIKIYWSLIYILVIHVCIKNTNSDKCTEPKPVSLDIEKLVINWKALKNYQKIRERIE